MEYLPGWQMKVCRDDIECSGVEEKPEGFCGLTWQVISGYIGDGRVDILKKDVIPAILILENTRQPGIVEAVFNRKLKLRMACFSGWNRYTSVKDEGMGQTFRASIGNYNFNLAEVFNHIG